MEKDVSTILREHYENGGSYNDTVIIDDNTGWAAMTANQAVRRFGDRTADIYFRLLSGGLFIGLE